MNEDELRAYEDKVRHQAAPDLRAVLDNLLKAATVVYTAVAGDTRTPLDPQAAETIRRQFAAALDRLRGDIEYGLIRQRLRDAARRAIIEAAAGTGLDVQVSPVTPLDVRWALKDLTAGLRADLAAAANYIRHGKLESFADLTAMAVAARKAANRLDRAATWIVHRAHNEGVQRAVDKAYSHGVWAATVWVPEPGACILCASLAGSIATPGEPYRPVVDVADPSSRPRGPLWSPPAHPHCLPGDTLVLSRSRITGATARVYNGELVTFRTLGNERFTATPNHPVLTKHGWIPVGQLMKGDHVLRHLGTVRERSVDDNDHHVPTRIEDVAEAFLGASGVTTTEVPVAPKDFHGDGAGSEVAIVGTNSRLSIPTGQVFGKQVFPPRDVAGFGFDIPSTTREPIGRELGATYGVMSGSTPSLALLHSGLSHAHEHGGTAPTGLHAGFGEYATDSRTGDGVLLAQRLLADTGLVTLDQVVEVWREPFSGHVYNLETEDGWYIGNGIVTHNCRCRAEVWAGAVGDDMRRGDRPLILRRAAQLAIASGKAAGSEPARLRAADRLLEVADALLPARARKAARKAVARKAFRR